MTFIIDNLPKQTQKEKLITGVEFLCDGELYKVVQFSSNFDYVIKHDGSSMVVCPAVNMTSGRVVIFKEVDLKNITLVHQVKDATYETI